MNHLNNITTTRNNCFKVKLNQPLASIFLGVKHWCCTFFFGVFFFFFFIHLFVFIMMFFSLPFYIPTANDLPQCHLSDLKCLPGVMTQIVQNHPNGHQGLSVPVLEPLHINAIDILQGGDSPIAIDLHFKNLDFSGLSKAVVKKVV